MFMATTWIVAADESRAKVLQVMDQQQHLTVVQAKDLSWLNARELERDFAKGSGRAP